MESSYLSGFVHFVVGEFGFFERHDLFPQLLPGERGVGVNAEPLRRRRIGLTGHQPRGSVICITVSLVVAGDDVQQHPIFVHGVEIGEAASDGGKHTPETQKITTK